MLTKEQNIIKDTFDFLYEQGRKLGRKEEKELDQSNLNAFYDEERMGVVREQVNN